MKKRTLDHSQFLRRLAQNPAVHLRSESSDSRLSLDPACDLLWQNGAQKAIG